MYTVRATSAVEAVNKAIGTSEVTEVATEAMQSSEVTEVASSLLSMWLVLLFCEGCYLSMAVVKSPRRI